MCAWSLACSGVEGSAGTPKPSAQLSLDRAVLLEEQVCFVHTFLKCICAHRECEGLGLFKQSHTQGLRERGMWVSCPQLCALVPGFIPG